MVTSFLHPGMATTCNRRALRAVVTQGTLGKIDASDSRKPCLPPRSMRWITPAVPYWDLGPVPIPPKRISSVTGTCLGMPAISGAQVKGHRADCSRRRRPLPFHALALIPKPLSKTAQPGSSKVAAESTELHRIKISTRDLRALHSKKFLDVTVYGAEPHIPFLSPQIRKSGPRNHFPFFAASHPQSKGASSSRSNNDDNDRNGTSMRRAYHSVSTTSATVTQS
ncbi:hypothetical protein EV421DRAFT_1130688 [Armillaria borealis]|uniref:Uncharacterized protein n=1 Tax=Armillaria borealis TaxID=47425 RepID=A0AA39J6L8_9AGAR|nr:hypothetical protein EV421DRAFT_1130688 [Armillaria borealis]